MKKKMHPNYILVFLFICLSAYTLQAQSKFELQGKVLNAIDKSGLPFASIHIEGTTIGTATNMEGQFSIKIPSEYQTGQLVVSYMGFVSKKVAIETLEKQGNTIYLQASVLELSAATVYPISAEEYILKSMQKRKENYAQSFQAEAYFRQKSRDQEQLLLLNEGYIQAYIPDFLDETIPIEQRLLLYQSKDSLELLAFGKRRRAKKVEKARQKADKKQEAFDEAAAQANASQVSMSLITPDIILDADPIRQIEPFLDSTRLHLFSYAFEQDRRYQGRDVIVISFSSKKKIKLPNDSFKSRLSGTLYFDKDTDALIGMDYHSNMSIPVLLKPVLLLAGFGLSNPSVDKQVRYTYHQGKWYPQTIQVDLKMDLKKRYWAAEKEQSALHVEILMAVNNIVTPSTQHIPISYQLDTDKDLATQVYPLEGVVWDEINRIKLEQMK